MHLNTKFQSIFLIGAKPQKNTPASQENYSSSFAGLLIVSSATSILNYDFTCPQIKHLPGGIL